MKLEIPDRFKKHLRVGTCSWKYDSWKGLLYDAETKYHRDDYLVDYSKPPGNGRGGPMVLEFVSGRSEASRPESTVETYTDQRPARFCVHHQGAQLGHAHPLLCKSSPSSTKNSPTSQMTVS